MPGGAQDVGTEDGAVVEGAVERGIGGVQEALAERPLGGAVVLGLHSAEVGDELAGVGEVWCGQVVVGQAQGEEICGRRGECDGQGR